MEHAQFVFLKVHLHEEEAMPLGDNNSDENQGATADRTVNYTGESEDSPPGTLKRILEELHYVNRRLDRLELHQPVFPQSLPNQISPPPRVRANLPSSERVDPEGPVSPVPQHNPTDPAAELATVQEKFNVIKASLERVILPTHLKLHDSRSGIKREDQPVLNVVGKCGRYIETALKLVSETDEGKPVDIGQLTIVLVANIKFLQDEFAALLVKGRFDNTTSQLFRSLQKNNSGFDEESLHNVRVAAELSSISNRFQSG